MKRTYKILVVVLSVLALVVAGSFSALATSVETATTAEENGQEDSSMEEMPQSTETMQPAETDQSVENTDVTSTGEADDLEKGETVGDASQTEGASEIETETSQIAETTEDELSLQADTIVDWEELLSGQTSKSGLYYYIQKYQYDCKIVYLEKYISYIEQQITACEKMYELGDVTENVLNSYQAQKVLADAELQTARNESEYNNLYLEKNELDYSDYNMKELKDVQSIEYYVENYPEKDYMTLARYVTDYNNALIAINAKQIAINALETDVNLANLLLEGGEISQLEFAEKEVSLAQAQYELEQYYANMNMAYYNLTEICE